MVFFCCDGCSETLKKNQVDGHAARCRRCVSVCCVDCNVSFYGDDYRAHTSCMTESERYEGKFAKRKNGTNNPQQEWMDIVTSCIDIAPMHLKGYLQTMSNLDNIPRKEKQFRNFTSNSLGLSSRGGGANDKVVGEIWNLLKAERDKRQAAKQARMEKAKEQREQQQKKTNEKKKEESDAAKQQNDTDSDDDDDDDEKKKDNANATTKSTTEKLPKDIDPKKVKKAMKKALKKAPNRSMKIKELRKVLGNKLGVPKSEKKRLKDLLKKAPSIFKKDQIKVDGKIVTLVSS